MSAGQKRARTEGSSDDEATAIVATAAQMSSIHSSLATLWMDKKREGEEDDAPAIDPNDGGSMRGEKMVSSPSRRHIGTQTSHVM